MKKNVMMRVASAMLVLTLLTTCIISGTFAKYTTKGELQDSARVAKWGVVIGITGNDMFKTNYEKDVTTTSFANTVEATQTVVAPGTRNDAGITITVSGTPEVAFKLTFGMGNIDDEHPMKDVFLAAGAYKDYTALEKSESENLTTGETVNTYAYPTSFVLASVYNPVKYTLTKTDKDGVVTKPVNEGTLAAVQAYFAGTDATKEYAAGTPINDTYKLTWAWNFDGNDKADTLLGNIAAGVETDVAAEKYSTSIAYKLTVTATQIDYSNPKKV